MARPLDAANKELIDPYVEAWLELGGLPTAAGPKAVRMVNVDLFGYAASANRIATAPMPYTAHLELQTGPNPEFDERTQLYNTLPRNKHGPPVEGSLSCCAPPHLLDALMSGVHEMRDSATYRANLAEGEAMGRAKVERNMLIRTATRKLGPPVANELEAPGGISDVAQLEAIADRIWEVSSWAKLLRNGA